MVNWKKLKRFLVGAANWAVFVFLVLVLWGIVRLYLGW